MSERVLWDLAGADPAVRFSPYCWRVKLALAHKGLAFETRPWRFTETEALAFSGQEPGRGKVPVLVDGERVVVDSFAIARHLEETHPDRPSLFGGAGGLALARFVTSWTEGVLHPALARMCVADIHACLASEDQAYFRETREARYDRRLEEVQADREERVESLRALLAPLRAMLAHQPFLGGDAPLYADYVVFGAFQWLRVVSAFEPLAAQDAVHAWRERLLDLHGGLARRAARAVG